MDLLPNFLLKQSTPLSNAFIRLGITEYNKATQYIKKLPYGRNKDKKNLLSIFDDKCGTCSTKHALLYQLALENNRTNIFLMMGIFKMDAQYALPLKTILEKYELDYIPEAHNYLLFDNQRVDCTTAHSKTSDFEDELLEEQQLKVGQITDYKVRYHKMFLKRWLQANNNISLTMNELWSVREECILSLSQQ